MEQSSNQVQSPVTYPPPSHGHHLTRSFSEGNSASPTHPDLPSAAPSPTSSTAPPRPAPTPAAPAPAWRSPLDPSTPSKPQLAGKETHRDGTVPPPALGVMPPPSHSSYIPMGDLEAFLHHLLTAPLGHLCAHLAGADTCRRGAGHSSAHPPGGGKRAARTQFSSQMGTGRPENTSCLRSLGKAVETEHRGKYHQVQPET